MRLEYFHLTQEHQPFLTGGGQGEVHIHQYQFKGFRAHSLQGLFRTGNSRHLIACPLEQEAE